LAVGLRAGLAAYLAAGSAAGFAASLMDGLAGTVGLAGAAGLIEGCSGSQAGVSQRLG